MTARCPCGLEATTDDGRCKLCELEGTFGVQDPDVVRGKNCEANFAYWDGCSYPSRRQRRISTTPAENPDAWHLLLVWWFETGPRFPRSIVTQEHSINGPRRPAPLTFLDRLLGWDFYNEEAA